MNLKKHYLCSAFVALISIGAYAQKDYTTASSGLKYKFFTQNKKGVKAKAGDMVTVAFTIKNHKDSIIETTYGKPRPLRFPLNASPFKGSFEEGLSLMSEGDSASFLVKADSMFNVKKGGLPLPAYIKPGSLLKFTVKLNKVQNIQDFKKEKLAHYEAQKVEDDKAINAYLTSKGLTAEKLEGGIYKVKLTEGTGAQLVGKGQLVTMNYTGIILAGEKPFDSSVEKKVPFEIELGVGLQIKGLDDGITSMKVGEKSILLIPSYLAYGERGQHGIVPPNSVLIYEVVILGAGAPTGK